MAFHWSKRRLRISHTFTLVVFFIIFSISSLMVPLERLNFVRNEPSTCHCSSSLHPINSSIPATRIGPRSCPSFQQIPGVVIFFHVSKTGGTSVRRLFQKRLDAVAEVRPRAKFSNVLPDLKKAVEGHSLSNKTLIIEIHDGINLNLVEMAPILSRLRQRAAINKIPFFLFTILREPLDYMVSFYNYQHVGGGGAGRFERGNATEDDFKRLSLGNPQCLFFARGEFATTQHQEVLRQGFDEEECISTIYPLFQQHMDWIDTMEELQTSTLPLLSWMFVRDKQVGASFAPQNIQRPSPKTPRIHLDKLSKTTQEYMQNMTRGDLFLYKSAKRDYPLSMWTDY